MRHTTTSVPQIDRGGHLLLCLSLILILLGANGARAEDGKPADTQILVWLREIKPLPKVHYSWPAPIEKLSDELLHEYVRLTHAVSLSGEWGKPEQVNRAVSICKRVNAAKPKILASIGINYSVWHRRFGKELPPTNTGPTHQAELEHLKTRMEAMRTARNAEKYGCAEEKKGHSTSDCDSRRPDTPLYLVSDLRYHLSCQCLPDKPYFEDCHINMYWFGKRLPERQP